jgi:hypothetical protein
VARNIISRRAGHDARLEQQASDEGRWIGETEGHRQIKTVRDEIAHSIPDAQLDGEIRVAG